MIAALDGSGGSADAAAWPALQVPAVACTAIPFGSRHWMRCVPTIAAGTMVGDAGSTPLRTPLSTSARQRHLACLTTVRRFRSFTSLDVAAELPYLPGGGAGPGMDRIAHRRGCRSGADQRRGVPPRKARLAATSRRPSAVVWRDARRCVWRATRDGESDLSAVPWQAAGAFADAAAVAGALGRV